MYLFRIPREDDRLRAALRILLSDGHGEGRIRRATADRLLGAEPLRGVIATVVAPEHRGHGVGRTLLRLRTGLPGAARRARIAEGNEPSRRMAAGAGWTPAGEATWRRK